MAVLSLTMAAVPAQAAVAAPGKVGDQQANNTYQKLLGCVTLEGVRKHQAQLQKIADNNNDPFYPGTRAVGTEGYAKSVDYVAGLLRGAGYQVTLDEFQFEFSDLIAFAQLTYAYSTESVNGVPGEPVPGPTFTLPPPAGPEGTFASAGGGQGPGLVSA